MKSFTRLSMMLLAICFTAVLTGNSEALSFNSGKRLNPFNKPSTQKGSTMLMQQQQGSGSGKAGTPCTVVSGPNKGKKGTYSSDGWCQGPWGGTECRRTPGSPEQRCKDGHVKTGGNQPWLNRPWSGGVFMR